MFGLLLGTTCLLLLTFLMFGRMRRHAYAHHGGRGCSSYRHHHPHWRRHDGERSGGRRGRWTRSGWLIGAAGRRLNLDEHQEDVVRVAAKQAEAALRTLRDIVRESRDELADAVKGENLDDARLDAVFEKWDESMVEARKDVVDALRRAHATLTPEQRKRLAEWLIVAGEVS